jgi:hypothetical protein
MTEVSSKKTLSEKSANERLSEDENGKSSDEETTGQKTTGQKTTGPEAAGSESTGRKITGQTTSQKPTEGNSAKSESVTESFTESATTEPAAQVTAAKLAATEPVLNSAPQQTPLVTPQKAPSKALPQLPQKVLQRAPQAPQQASQPSPQQASQPAPQPAPPQPSQEDSTKTPPANLPAANLPAPDLPAPDLPALGLPANLSGRSKPAEPQLVQPSAQPTFRAEPGFFKQPEPPAAPSGWANDWPNEPLAERPHERLNGQAAIGSSGFLVTKFGFSPTLEYIVGVFVSTRLMLTFIGLGAYAILPLGYGKQISWSPYRWLDMWGVWDSRWYMDIVQNGYSTATKLPEFPDQTNFPFFPLYPLLMKLLGNVLGGQYFWAGLLISNVCLLLSSYVLYRLVEMQWGKKIARRSIKYLFLFPVSFILSGVFTESLYLLLSLLCFYLAKRRNWWLAGLCGALLSATRTLGVLIALPLLFEYLQSVEFKARRIRLNSLFLLLVPLGLMAFCWYNYRVTGDFLFFKTNQAAWDREFMNPVTALWQALVEGISEPSVKKLLEVSFAIASFTLLSASFKTIGFSYWLLGMYSLIIPLSAGIASMPRFTLPVFPLFIILASLSCKEGWDRWMTLGLGAFQGALMVLWCTGQGLVI